MTQKLSLDIGEEPGDNRGSVPWLIRPVYLHRRMPTESGDARHDHVRLANRQFVRKPSMIRVRPHILTGMPSILFLPSTP